LACVKDQDVCQAIDALKCRAKGRLAAGAPPLERGKPFPKNLEPPEDLLRRLPRGVGLKIACVVQADKDYLFKLINSASISSVVLMVRVLA